MSIGGWFRDRPRLLEWAYRATHRALTFIDPILRRLGYETTAWLLLPAEEFSKKALFDCRMCGQCILHATGMTCPMTCPKNMRNGPCGGVSLEGRCEVIPEMRCVWVEAFERSTRMATFGAEMLLLQPPVDQRLQGSSAWVNLLTGVDARQSAGWTAQAPELQNSATIPLDKIETWPKSTSRTAV